jgi:hypothetical protein
VAVLNALASDFRGMTRKAIATHASKELDYEVHAKNELERLLPKMQDAGLICKDARTSHLANHREWKGQYRQRSSGESAGDLLRLLFAASLVS